MLSSRQGKSISLCHGAVQFSGDAVREVHSPQPASTESPHGTVSIPELLAKRFADPLDFPPVRESIVPGDSVAIAVEPGVVAGTETAIETARLLAAHGHGSNAFTIVLAVPPEAENTDVPCRIEVFDAADEQQHAFLMASGDGTPLYVSRTLFDADVVIPIGGFHGIVPRDGICPAFCDQATREHLFGLEPAAANATIQAINDNLGVFWQISVLDRPGDIVSDILAGDRRAVLREGIRRMGEAWGVEIDESPKNLVIVTLESPHDQSWDNVRQALRVADAVASSDGAIALVSRIDSLPRRREPQIVELLRRRHVYLFSNLPGIEAENAGFAPIANGEEISRLIGHYGETTLLRDAHKVDLRPRQAV
jgi:hypothetical protein